PSSSEAPSPLSQPASTSASGCAPRMRGMMLKSSEPPQKSDTASLLASLLQAAPPATALTSKRPATVLRAPHVSETLLSSLAASLSPQPPPLPSSTSGLHPSALTPRSA